MIKRVTVVARKPGLSNEVFYQRWRVQHAEMVLRLPGVVGYTQNHVIRQATDDTKASAVDGFAEIWFADEKAMQAALETDLWKAIVDDARDFLGTVSGYLIDEHVLREAKGTAQ